MTMFNLLKKITKFLSDRGVKDWPGVYPVFMLFYRIMRGKGEQIKEVEGIKIKFDLADEGIVPSLVMLGCYEPHETKLLKETLKPGMIFVDVGANIGYYSLIASKMVGNKGKVFAFEPAPRNFKFLKENVELNNLKNIKIIQKAVSDKKGELSLYIDQYNSGNASLEKTARVDSQVQVETVPLDDLIDKVDVLKADTQGAEELVLKGAEKLMKRNNLTMFIEFWPHGLKKFNTDPQEFLNKLKKYGFKREVIDDNLGGTTNMSDQEIITKCGKKGFVNLILTKVK